jgi:GNAT superfamily N-acetyltransferase
MSDTRSLSIVPLQEAHLEDAARLVAARYTALRRQAPDLPERYEHAESFLPRLAKLVAAATGVAALRGGKLVGFLASWRTANWRGRHATYSPEWANGVAGEQTGRIYEQMYAALAGGWVADRYFDHYITIFSHDRDGIAAWQWLAFGYVVMDAVRSLAPLAGPLAEVEIRQAGASDRDGALALWRGLHAHLIAAPTFLVDSLHADPAEFEAWLNNPTHALWLAMQGGQAVACIGIGPANENACTIIRDEGTASIVSAFTRADARGGGIASALLDRALAWARTNGYRRCAVDFETMNSLAAHFWPRHFQPVCHSLGRVVNEHILD